MKERKLPHHTHLYMLNLGKTAQLLTYRKEENPEQILKSAILSTFVEVEFILSWLHLIFFFPRKKEKEVILSSVINKLAFVYIYVNARKIKITELSTVAFYMNCKTQEKMQGNRQTFHFQLS